MPWVSDGLGSAGITLGLEVFPKLVGSVCGALLPRFAVRGLPARLRQQHRPHPAGSSAGAAPEALPELAEAPALHFLRKRAKNRNRIRAAPGPRHGFVLRLFPHTPRPTARPSPRWGSSAVAQVRLVSLMQRRPEAAARYRPPKLPLSTPLGWVSCVHSAPGDFEGSKLPLLAVIMRQGWNVRCAEPCLHPWQSPPTSASLMYICPRGPGCSRD